MKMYRYFSSIINFYFIVCGIAISVAPRAISAQRTGRSYTVSYNQNQIKLLVVLTVDQLRADYIPRFRGQLSGGLQRLYTQGAVFTNAFHDHALTLTAPGHATVLSGRFPVHTGISSNEAGVEDRTVKLISTPEDKLALRGGASPKRFHGTTLVDWIRSTSPGTQVLSLAGKDRGAILPVGKSKSSVFWYWPTGNFTTSTYYTDTLSTWLEAFNAKKLAMKYKGHAWRLLMPSSVYPEPDSVIFENGGDNFSFPHLISTDSTTADLYNFPWLDDLTLQAALEGLQAMGLGTKSNTDVLALSLSATDLIGHKYGPDSREIHDQIVRLDRALGTFLDTLFTLRDPNSIIVLLTADHGVGPIPMAQAHGQRGHLVDVSAYINMMRGMLQLRGVQKSYQSIRFSDGVLNLDHSALIAANINIDSLVRKLRTNILRHSGVLRVDRISELQRADTVNDAVARRWLHTFAADSEADLVVTLKPYNYWSRSYFGADHGTPYDYDAQVPIIFYGAPFKAGKYSMPVRTVDIAPTLAAVLRVRPLEHLDGNPLYQAIRLSE